MQKGCPVIMITEKKSEIVHGFDSKNKSLECSTSALVLSARVLRMVGRALRRTGSGKARTLDLVQKKTGDISNSTYIEFFFPDITYPKNPLPVNGILDRPEPSFDPVL